MVPATAVYIIRTGTPYNPPLLREALGYIECLPECFMIHFNTSINFFSASHSLACLSTLIPAICLIKFKTGILWGHYKPYNSPYLCFRIILSPFHYVQP